MSSIKLTDSYGFELDVTNGSDKASFFKRLLTDAEFVFDTADVKAVEMLPLGGNPGPTLPMTLKAEASCGIGAKGFPSLKIDSTCTAKLSKSVDKDCSKTLGAFQATLPDGADTKSAGYLCFETSAEVDTGVSDTLTPYTFGLTEGKTVTLSNSRYDPQLASAKLVDATRALLSNFVIPGDISDLEFLPEYNICSVEGKGSLKFKVSAGYQFFTNPLTSGDIPVAGTLALKASGNATLTFALTVGAGYKISVLKKGAQTVRLAVERSRNTDFDVAAKVNAQVTATVQGQDMLALLLGVVSPDPDSEIKQMNAKLDDAEHDAISDAIKCAIQNNFELAAQAEIEDKLESDTVILYELDLNGLSERAKSALESALHGDFTGLADVAATKQDGVIEKQSVFTNTNTTTRRLTVHLLNVFQAGSISALISKETVKSTPAGDLAITDSATAHGTDFLSFPAQKDGLRKLLFTSAMITSAYKGTKTQLGAPDLSCELVHFQYDQKAGMSDLQQNITALEMLQVLPDDQAATAVQRAKTQKPAPSTINISLTLSADDCGRLFLNGNTARTPQEYESAGKAAMYRLIASDPNQKDLAQLLTTSNSTRWNNLKTADTVSDMAVKLGNGNDMATAQRYFTEVSRVKWWTEHMSALASCVEAFRDKGAGLDPKNATFQTLHQALNEEAKAVSALTDDYFKLPWGILAVSQLLGFTPKVEVLYSSQPISLAITAPPAKVAAAS